MKHIYLLVVCALGIIYLSIRSLGIHTVSHERETIDVSLVYKDQTTRHSLPNYTTLEILLDTISLDDDVDIQKINPHLILSHGDLITIPIKTEGTCISINTGTVSELSQLNGVGPKTAESIILFRESHGMFQSLESIMQVKGIGIKKFEKMVDQMCL